MRQITLEPNNFATPTTTGLASYLTLAFALAVEGWGELEEDEEEEVMDTISNEGEEEEEDRCAGDGLNEKALAPILCPPPKGHHSAAQSAVTNTNTEWMEWMSHRKRKETKQ